MNNIGLAYRIIWIFFIRVEEREVFGLVFCTILFLNTEVKNVYLVLNNYPENHTGSFIKFCIFYGD